METCEDRGYECCNLTPLPRDYTESDYATHVREFKVMQYNAAIIENDNERARALGDDLLHDIHTNIMQEDQYQQRTHRV